MKSIPLKYGVVIILKNSLFVDTGLFLLKDSLLKTIAMMINSLVHLLEIWVTKVLFWLRKETKISIDTLKLNYLLELMETGRLNLSYLHTHSSTMVLVSLMVTVIALFVPLMLANNNVLTLFLSKLLIILIVVDMIALKMVPGLLIDIPEYIEIYLLLRL